MKHGTKLYSFTLLLLLTSSSFLFGKDLFASVKNLFSSAEHEKKPIECVVFIHGTMGSSLSVLFPESSLNLQSTGESVAKVVPKLRDCSWYYRDQVALRKQGLVEIDVSKPVVDSEFSALQSIRAYSAINDNFFPNRTSKYYCFGWGGMFSSQERIKDAVDLYNSLLEEKKRLQQQGFEPEFTLLAHSHGGNVALLLHEIKRYVELRVTKEVEYEHCFDQEFLEVMRHCPSKKDLLEIYPNFYLPESADLSVGFLAMLGTPIQSQTELLANGNFFGIVVNFFSSGDLIQRLDYKTAESGRSYNKFFHNISKNDSGRMQGAGIVLDCQVSWVKKSCYSDCVVKKDKGPSHLDYWFVQRDSPAWDLANPLPLVSLFPALISLIRSNHAQLLSKSSVHVSMEKSKKEDLKITAFANKTTRMVLDRTVISKSILEQEKMNMNKSLALQEKYSEDDSWFMSAYSKFRKLVRI